MSPMVDMRRALTNPYTLDKFAVVRRQQIKGDNGIVGVIPQTFPRVYGVVTPATQQKDLQRMSDAQIQSKAILVVTRFGLRGATEDQLQTDFQPDIIVWNGDNYLVIFPDDYSNYAQGFIRAVCFMTDLSAVPSSIGQALANAAALQSGQPPLLTAGGRVQHPPLETPDGTRASFTFPRLPLDPNNFDIVWNDLVQGGYTREEDVITLGATPQGTVPVPGPTDTFYAVW
jgi:hypothetical protein